jgi:cytoplasmic iron level regulating protein YaaA (DUF328/UPF0246 family)
MDNTNNLKFTAEELEQFHALQTKARAIFERHDDYERKFGKLAGSVFDGGFYTEMDYSKMTTEERNEFIELEDQMDYVNELLG